MQEDRSSDTALGVLPTFVACLGVLAYLQPATVRRTFQSIAGMVKGSELVFAFAPKQDEAPRRNGESMTTAEKAAAHGEPWLTWFSSEELVDELLKSGFGNVFFLSPCEAGELYFRGRGDLPAPRTTRICRAIV